MIKHKKFRISNLSKGLLTRVLIFSGLFTLVFSSIQIYSDFLSRKEALKSHVESSLNVYSGYVSRLVLAPYSGSSANLINNFGDELINTGQFESIKISDSVGQIVYKYPQNYLSSSQSQVFFLRFEILDKVFEPGIIEYTINYAQVEKAIQNEILLLVFLQFIKTFFVSLFILFIFYQLVVTHLNQIIDWVKSYNTKSQFQPLPLGSECKNEIGFLKVAVSDLGQKVHEHTFDLERLVTQRTLELENRTHELEVTQLELQKLIEKKTQKMEGISQTINDWLFELDRFGNVCHIDETIDTNVLVNIEAEYPTPLLTIMPFSKNSYKVLSSALNDLLHETKPIRNIECQIVTPKAGEMWLTISILPFYGEHGELVGYNGSISNISEFKRLEKLAFTDGLTGVANRVNFMQVAEKELNRARRLDYDLGVIMLDLDHFKDINDNYGHPAGDEVLKLVSQSFNRCLREGDLLGRLGGEEFAIITPGTNSDGMLKLVQRLKNNLSDLDFSFLEPRKLVTVSIGYTKVLKNESFEAALQRADEHLYSAKNNGRNTYITDIFSSI